VWRIRAEADGLRGSEREIEGVIYVVYTEGGNLPLITGLLEVRHRQGQAVYIYVYDYDEVRSCACCVSVYIYILYGL